MGKNSPGAVRMAFGPMGDALPSSWTQQVNYPTAGLRMTLELGFDGRRVLLRQFTIRRIDDDESLTPRELALLEVGAVVHEAARQKVDPGHGMHIGRQHERQPTAEVLGLVTQVYWAEYVTWGEPRRAIMGYWDLPSHTAVRWIRRARELFKFPDTD